MSRYNHNKKGGMIMSKRLFIMIGMMGLCMTGFGLTLAFGGGVMIEEEKADRNIGIMTGGVGIEERDAMEKKAAPYDLKLVFAVRNGSYLSGIHVRIKDATGNLLIDRTSRGPWFYADLPPGAYVIEVLYRGESKTRRVVTGTGMKKVMFHWKE
jgi:hypothetical protein